MSNASSQTITDQTEIERIMKEIEDLERKLSPDSTPPPNAAVASEPVVAKTEAEPPPPPPPALEPLAPTLAAVPPPAPPEPSEADADAIAVTPINTPTFHTQETTMTPNTPNLSDDLLTSASFESPLAGDGSLGLKVSGCTEIQLEFARAGVSVSLFCTDTGLVIRTDQGAEFKVPFATPLTAPRAA